jgi:hypothetical protein
MVPTPFPPGLHAVGLYTGPVARRGPENGRIHRDNRRRDVCATRGINRGGAHLAGGYRGGPENGTWHPFFPIDVGADFIWECLTESLQPKVMQSHGVSSRARESTLHCKHGSQLNWTAARSILWVGGMWVVEIPVNDGQSELQSRGD